MTPPDEAVRVARVARVALRYRAEAFRFPERLQPEIEAYWTKRTAEVPEFFNGTIYLTFDHKIIDGVLTGTCRPTAFKQFLHWRETRDRREGFVDAFGSAIVRSREGHFVVARASRHTLNAGWAYFFGGFIDVRDECPDGTIDIDGSIARELREEAGLDTAELVREPDYILSEHGSLLSIGIVYRSSATSSELETALERHARTADEQELEEILVVRDVADLAGRRIKPYAAAVMGALFEKRC